MIYISPSSRVQLCISVQFTLVFFGTLVGILVASKLTTCVPTSTEEIPGGKRTSAEFGFIMVSFPNQFSPKLFPNATRRLSSLLIFYGLDMTRIIAYSILLSLTFRKNILLLHLWQAAVVIQMLLLSVKLTFSLVEKLDNSPTTSTNDQVADWILWIHGILLLVDSISLLAVQSLKGHIGRLENALAIALDEHESK